MALSKLQEQVKEGHPNLQMHKDPVMQEMLEDREKARVGMSEAWNSKTSRFFNNYDLIDWSKKQ